MTPIELTDATWDDAVLGSDLLVLVDFWAPWCVPCKKVSPIVESAGERHAGRLVAATLDVDQHPSAAQRYSVLSLPTLIVFKGGEPVERLHGAVSEKKLEKALVRHLAD